MYAALRLGSRVTDETREGRSRNGVQIKGEMTRKDEQGGGKGRAGWWERAGGHVEATRTTKNEVK